MTDPKEHRTRTGRTLTENDIDAIAREVEESTGGEVRLGPGTLYGTLDRMTDAGLIVATGQLAADSRRVYFRATPLGRGVARAEATRLARLVDLARAKSLLTRGRS